MPARDGAPGDAAWRGRAAGAVHLLQVALLGLLALWGTPNPFDEGYAVYGAMRILDGQVPHRDFWVVYPPGQFATLAALFKLFGASLLVERVYDASVRAAVYLACTLLAARLGVGRGGVVATGGLVVLAFGLYGGYFAGYSMYPGLALALLAVVSFEHGARRHDPRGFVWAGVLLGVAALFRHDVAVYLGLALPAGIVALRWRGAASALPAVRDALRLLLPAAGVALVALAALAVWGVPLGQMWEDLVLHPLRGIDRTRQLPLPPLLPDPADTSTYDYLARPFWLFLLMQWIPFYLPLAVHAATLAQVAGRWLRGQLPGAREATRMALAVFGLLLLRTALSRADEIHLLPTSIVALVLAAPLLQRPGAGWPPLPARARALARTLAAAGIGVYLVLLGLALVPQIMGLAALGACRPVVERAWCLALPRDQADAIQAVRALTAPGEPIFVGSTRHDLLVLSDVLFYFLADRHTPARYYDLAPGVVTTAAVQAEIVSSLERAGVRVVVRVRSDRWPPEPNESSTVPGATVLDEYLASRFVPDRSFGDYQIWLRRPS